VDKYRFIPRINTDIFGEVDKSKLRKNKPGNGAPSQFSGPNELQLRKLRKLKPQLSTPLGNTHIVDPNLAEGTLVNHNRFGKGTILSIEGAGNDKKAEIKFEKGDVKKLLLRFAKLEVLS
jgi:DNA helicase-2/ATP-dependent DNA helicase PcrA